MQASPVQMLFDCRTKTLLPTTEQLLKPQIPAGIEQKQQTAKAKQAKPYNRTARDLSELLPGQTVHIQSFKSGEWKKAVVSKVLSHRFYKVTLDRNLCTGDIGAPYATVMKTHLHQLWRLWLVMMLNCNSLYYSRHHHRKHQHLHAFNQRR